MCGTWCADNLYYLSVSWLSNDTFGQTRLLREVTNAWLQRRFGYSGQKFSDQPPSLTAEEISSIPGAEASLGNLDSMRFEVLGRIADQMQIKQDEHKFWAAQGGEISETYNASREQHAQLLSKLGAQGSEARGGQSTTDAANAGTQDRGIQKPTQQTVFACYCCLSNMGNKAASLLL